MANYKRTPGNKDSLGSKDDPKIFISFIYLDIAQGQNFENWDSDGLLIKLISLIRNLNCRTVPRALAEGLIIQYDVENKKKWSVHNMPLCSNWTYPKTLTINNVKWCKSELGRKVRVIGFFEDNYFHIVFLDKSHDFYPSDPK